MGYTVKLREGAQFIPAPAGSKDESTTRKKPTLRYSPSSSYKKKSRPSKYNSDAENRKQLSSKKSHHSSNKNESSGGKHHHSEKESVKHHKSHHSKSKDPKDREKSHHSDKNGKSSTHNENFKVGTKHKSTRDLADERLGGRRDIPSNSNIKKRRSKRYELDDDGARDGPLGRSSTRKRDNKGKFKKDGSQLREDHSQHHHSSRIDPRKSQRTTTFHEKKGHYEREEAEHKTRRDPAELKEIVHNGKTLFLKRFDPAQMNIIAKNPAVMMIAKRGSGKSVGLRAIMKLNEDIPGGLVISPSERLNHFYKDFFPELFIYEKLEDDTVQLLLERQTLINEKNDRRKKKGQKLIDPRAWFIMDDTLSQKAGWAKSEGIMEVMYNGRHYNLFYVLTMQYPLGIGPELRCNFDFVFLFGENYNNIRHKLYDYYAGMFETFNFFVKVFSKVTARFGCMVINNREKSDFLQDIVFWWRAKDEPILKMMGCKSFVKYHKKWFNKDHNKRKPEDRRFNMDMVRKKRKTDIDVDVELEDMDFD
jgi:hypothetical protein